MEDALLELELLANNTLTEEQLQTLTGFDDLSQAHRLVLKNIVSKKVAIHGLGDMCPNLKR